MKKSISIPFLLAIILIEGYIVLSAELLAIRQTIPFVGSGTDTVSIIIAAVLMPLAFGYQRGGAFRPGLQKSGRRKGRYLSVRGKLVQNLLISLIVLTVGLSFFTLTLFFEGLTAMGITSRLVKITLYAALFLVTPVYLMGQTIPLISNYFSRNRLPEITGHILFFSTIGSFLGAVFSTIVLMTFVGVHYTTAVSLALVAMLIFFLSKNKFSETVIAGLVIACAGIALNSENVMRSFNIVENNRYNTAIAFEDKEGNHHLSLNMNDDSMYNRQTGKKHAYIEFIEQQALAPLANSDTPKNILVIGAGGFTFGSDDTFNHYDYVDIDQSLRHLAEKHVLGRPLHDNVTFHPLPARAFLAGTDETYDLILLDAYLGRLSIPEHLVTREFFLQVRSRLNSGGIMIANAIMSPNFNSKFSRKFDNTIRSVFPNISRHIIGDYALWNEDTDKIVNVIYLYTNNAANDEGIYTDNLNTIYLDKPQTR